MELKGSIKKINEIQTFDSGFQKREVILLTEDTYPQPISIEFLKDKVDLPDAHKVGDKVTIGINLQGRSWVSPQGDEKFFNQIVGWKITADSVAPKKEVAQPDELDF